MLCSEVDLPFRQVRGDMPCLYRGALAENYVAQSFAASGIPLYYYSPSAGMEIDYLLDIDGDIIPVEVKAGRHKHANSLRAYLEQQKPAYGIRISTLNFGMVNGIFSVPLYAVFCLGK